MPKGCLFEPFDKRFWRYVDKCGANECWLWIGAKGKKGYGTFSLCPHTDIGAHVLSWIMANGGRKPRKKVVMHTCDTPACVNPRHLIVGSYAENMADMSKKWRTKTKLTEEQVREIRESDEPYRVLAAKYGLKSHKSITNIKSGISFPHLK